MCHIKNPCVYKWHLSAIVPWTDIKPDFSWLSGAVSVKARLFAHVTGGEVCGALDAAVEWVLVDALHPHVGVRVKSLAGLSLCLEEPERSLESELCSCFHKDPLLHNIL